jgi:hypothetical protein
VTPTEWKAVHSLQRPNADASLTPTRDVIYASHNATQPRVGAGGSNGTGTSANMGAIPQGTSTEGPGFRIPIRVVGETWLDDKTMIIVMESTDSDRVTVAIHNESYGLVLKGLQEVDGHVKAVCEDLIRKAAVPVGHDRKGECQQVNHLPVTEYEYDDYSSTEPEPEPDVEQSLGGDSGAYSSGDSDPPSGRDSDAPSAVFSGENEQSQEVIPGSPPVPAVQLGCMVVYHHHIEGSEDEEWNYNAERFECPHPAMCGPPDVEHWRPFPEGEDHIQEDDDDDEDDGEYADDDDEEDGEYTNDDEDGEEASRDDDDEDDGEYADDDYDDEDGDCTDDDDVYD